MWQCSAGRKSPRLSVYRGDRTSYYTDGSGSGSGGWGLVVVRRGADGDREMVGEFCGGVVVDAKAKPWLGAARATNNTAELQGVAEALRYLLERSPRDAEPAEQQEAAVIVSDSQYALDMMLGIKKAHTNRRMVKEVQALWARARAARQDPGRGHGLFARHIHSHARGAAEDGHQHNERADALAGAGAEGVTRAGHAAAWSAYPPLPPPPRRAHRVTEAERIVRSAHAFGALNAPVPEGALLPPAHVERLYRTATARLRATPVAGDVRRREAESRLWAAKTLLSRPDAQRGVRDRLMAAGLRPVTSDVTCAVDARALRQYVETAGADADVTPVHKHGQPYGATRRELVTRLLGRVQGEGSDGLGWVRLRYTHSTLGAGLVAAGHVIESREYVCREDRAADPFGLPRAQRALALARVGVDFDDDASFPRAKADVVMPCRVTLQCFLRHRETILAQVGAHFLAGRASPDAIRGHAKALFNSFDMDGTLGAWRERMGLRDGERPSGGMVVRLGQGHIFDFQAHREAQRAGTQWLAQRMRAMTQYVEAHLRTRGDDRRLEHPERTVASYVFQEAEGVSRRAKVWWARCKGHAVLNLQHDGLVLQLRHGDGAEAVRQQLAAVSTRALGYQQPVAVKSHDRPEAELRGAVGGVAPPSAPAHPPSPSLAGDP